MASILVISPTPSHPQDAGNRARIFSLLSSIKGAGHKVFFAFVMMEEGDEKAMAGAWDGLFLIPYHRPPERWLKRKYDNWAKRQGKLGVLPFRIDDWYIPQISQQLIEIQQQVKPEVVLVEYIFLSKALDCFGSKTLKILDTHDIFGDRHKQYIEKGMVPRWFYTKTDQEKKALDRADVILAIQEKEAEYFRGLTRKKVITAGHTVQIFNRECLDSEADRLLFVGSANPINVEALHWFLSDVFPLLRNKIPNIKLEVVGDCAEKVTATEGLILTGPVHNLAPCYCRARVVINPTRFGTGLKIKAIEAIAYGRPLVTTSAGAAGLEDWAGKAFLVADLPVDFAEAIEKIYFFANFRAELVSKAQKFIREYNLAALQSLIDTIERVKD